MVNRPEGPTLTKSYRQRKTKEQFLDMGIQAERGMRREREAGSSKLQTEDRRDRDFSWIGCVIFDDADECTRHGEV